MAYWAADGAALPSLLRPLTSFLARIRTNGEHTATSMYGCRGWVAHGNLDGLSFSTGLNSEVGAALYVCIYRLCECSYVVFILCLWVDRECICVSVYVREVLVRSN